MSRLCTEDGQCAVAATMGLAGAWRMPCESARARLAAMVMRVAERREARISTPPQRRVRLKCAFDKRIARSIKRTVRP